MFFPPLFSSPPSSYPPLFSPPPFGRETYGSAPPLPRPSRLCAPPSSPKPPNMPDTSFPPYGVRAVLFTLSLPAAGGPQRAFHGVKLRVHLPKPPQNETAYRPAAFPERPAASARFCKPACICPQPFCTFSRRSEERRVGKECRSRWSP